MRTTFIIPLLFCISACSKADLSAPLPKITAEEAVAKAEADLRRVNLSANLEHAGNDLNKIAAVYNAAVELGDEKIRQKADVKLSSVALPIAEVSPLKNRIPKLQAIVPRTSDTWQKLDAIRLQKEKPLDPI